MGLLSASGRNLAFFQTQTVQKGIEFYQPVLNFSIAAEAISTLALNKAF